MAHNKGQLCVLQLANVERRLSRTPGTSSHVPAARCYYRAARALLQRQIDPLSSPNGEASPGSQRQKELMSLVKDALRVLASWAQMELDERLAAVDPS